MCSTNILESFIKITKAKYECIFSKVAEYNTGNARESKLYFD